MPSRDFPAPADLLGEVLHLLRLTGTLYCRAELTAPWGVAVPRLDELMTFQVVTEGRCVLEVEGAEPHVLEQGSVTLIPHGTPHRLRSAPGAPTTPLFDIPVEQVSDRYEVLRHGGGGALTRVHYGAVRFDHVTAQRLIRQLPLVLHAGGWDQDATGWLHSTLRFMAVEARTPRAGGETVITRLADILVVQAVRSWLDSAPEATRGWLAAVRDEHVGRALLSIHRAPEHPWTVAELARHAHLSRSVFAARFTALVGEPAMRYLADWRMQLARAHLRQSAEPLSRTAHRFGYRSEAAFSRAFKRAFGVPPGSLRHPTSTT